MKKNLLHENNGRFGNYGGTFLPELLMAPVHALKDFWKEVKTDKTFIKELNQQLLHYAGRPTPLTEVPNFSTRIKGPRIFLKREDLLHTGAHKLNNALGQCLLAKKMGKKRIIAETGAGQHGVATAAAAARLGLACTVFMGQFDMQRQALNVHRMQLFGAEVVPVTTGTKTLKDAVNEALRNWSGSFSDTHYCLGSALGPHPYPDMTATFQSIIGEECKQQFVSQFNTLPDKIIACVGGGSNAIGIFSAFIDHPEVGLIGVEAGGHGLQLGEHAARFKTLTPGVLHGCYTYILQNQQGQIAPTASISAGLDYPAVGPQHAFLFDIKRAEYHAVNNEEAINALKILAESEGILCALESAHALAYIIKIAKHLSPNQSVIINLSGRGDKDLASLPESFEDLP